MKLSTITGGWYGFGQAAKVVGKPTYLWLKTRLLRRNLAFCLRWYAMIEAPFGKFIQVYV